MRIEAEGYSMKNAQLTKKPAWKRALEASITEADAGKTKVFGSGEEFIEFLQKKSKMADRRLRGKG
jgi:hypothetical protein